MIDPFCLVTDMMCASEHEQFRVHHTRSTVMPFITLRPCFVCHSSEHTDINTECTHLLVGVHWCIPQTFLACSQAGQQHIRPLHVVLLQRSPSFTCALHSDINIYLLKFFYFLTYYNTKINSGNWNSLKVKVMCIGLSLQHILYMHILYMHTLYNVTNTLQLLTDEVVVLARLKLQPSWLWRKWPKCYGEVHQLIRLITDRNDPRIWICDPTRVVFFFWYL